MKDHGAHLVKAGGGGLERGEQGENNEFNVWTREAGSGQLAISVEGPSKAEINFSDRKDGSCDVSYKVSEPGMYVFTTFFFFYAHLYMNDLRICVNRHSMNERIGSENNSYFKTMNAL